MKRRTRAYTLVEVMVAGAILLAALVPLVSLITTGSTQAVKARDRALASHLATAVIEELAARPAGNRADLAPTPVATLAWLRPLIDRQKADRPADAALLDATLATFQVQATVGGPPPTPLRVTVTWRESGEPRSLVRDGALGVP